MSSIGAAPAMDIDMSLLPPSGTQETAPIATGDDDDVTVAGSNLSPPTPVDTDPNSLVLKLEFRSQTKETPAVYASQAKTIIAEIMEKFPNEVTVFDNQEKKIQRIDAALSNDKFNRIFNLHVRKSSPKAQKKQHCHFYQFRITTTAAFSEIRKAPSVEKLLKNYGAILQTTPWQANIVDTAIIGWQMGLIPSYMTSTEATMHIRRNLEMHSGTAPKKIPTFHCISQTVTATLQSRRVTIKVYCVSVQKAHFHKLSDIFAKAYLTVPKENKFIFFKTKHESPETFAKAAFIHAKFVNDHRVVAIKGIDPDYFFDFEEVLRTEFSLIKQVFTTASTHTRNVHGHYLGRYNLLCRTEHFVELAKALHDELSPLYIKHAIEVHAMELTDGMEPVDVVSNFPGKIGVHGGASVGSGNSLTTRNSYSTHCVSVFFDDIDIESEAEMNDQPPPPHLTTTPTTMATMSPLTTHPSSYASAVMRNLQQQPNNEANQLRQQMDNLTVMMTTVLQRLAAIESATTTGTAIAQQPSPARIRKKNKSSTDQGGTSMDMDASAVDHNNHESS
jgi:hypothetical protein